MKRHFITIIFFLSLLGFTGCSNSNDPSNWDTTKVDKWFESREYLNGWNVTPDPSINKREFAVSYFKHKDRWDKAFAFLKDDKLSQLEVKRYDLDGTNLFAPITEYLTKNEEDAKFEAHRKYADIQYVINGAEQMSVAPQSAKQDVVAPYDSIKDLEFMTVTKADSYEATPERFFIFFPTDIHRPSVKIGENKLVRKVVVKVKLD